MQTGRTKLINPQSEAFLLADRAHQMINPQSKVFLHADRPQQVDKPSV